MKSSFRPAAVLLVSKYIMIEYESIGVLGVRSVEEFENVVRSS